MKSRKQSSFINRPTKTNFKFIKSKKKVDNFVLDDDAFVLAGWDN